MIRPFAHAPEVLRALDHALPQPDQLCGPFCAAVALTAMLDADRPSVTEIAIASGSTLWLGDATAARPPGVPVVTDGFDSLPTADDARTAGTTAAGLASGIETATDGRVSVLPVARPDVDRLSAVLHVLLHAQFPFTLLANVHTRDLTEFDWSVGHFVILWGVDEHKGTVAVADTYRELGAPDMPPGCREVAVATLAAALSTRGLLLLVPAAAADEARAVLASIAADADFWSV